MTTFLFDISFIAIIGSSVLTALSSALLKKGKIATEEFLKVKSSLFFRKSLNLCFGRRSWEGLLFAISFSKQILRISYAVASVLFLTASSWFTTSSLVLLFPIPGAPFLLATLCTLALSMTLDFLLIVVSQRAPTSTLRLLSPLASCYLFLCFPLTAPLFQLMRYSLPTKPSKDPFDRNFKIRDKVYELLQETELGAYLDPTEQKFILSMVSFKERIAREVMVPRINVFSLSQETLIEDAAAHFSSEGYSRIPVYRDNVDNIIGVLLYKDVLQFYLEQTTSPSELKQPILKLVKPVIYTPETKKISQLLQDFRNKQIHMSIIVDEWGGTEGIVTIEDILEELVGEIADEYDTAQQNLFSPLPDGSWIIDAKMSIIDIQEELGIDIPNSPEYDTIGGYIFHRAGSIPLKGWKIHHDEFDLEVISSNERAIDKIKIASQSLS